MSYDQSDLSPGRTITGRKGIVFPYPIVDAGAPIQVEDLRPTVVRLRVPFVAPKWKHLDMLIEEKGDDWVLETNRVFDLLVWMPVSILSDPKVKCQDVLIMFNGLNEIMPWHTWLYDALGADLADRGIACILLPTPFHLNRTPQYKKPGQRTASGMLKKPTDTKRANAPYLNFHQTFRELDELIKLVQDLNTSSDRWGL